MLGFRAEVLEVSDLDLTVCRVSGFGSRIATSV